MAETKQITFSHEEVVTALVKKQELHEGFWQLYVEFGIGAANVGPSPDQLLPAAIVPVLKIGLQRVDKKENHLTVDAAEVNPIAGDPAPVGGGKGKTRLTPPTNLRIERR